MRSCDRETPGRLPARGSDLPTCGTECSSAKDASVDHDDITCKQFIRTLANFLAGELDADGRGRSELHLSVCPECVRYLEGYEITIRLGSDALREDSAEGEAGLPRELASVILAARKRS
jgi:anti-sigma factor RsiW